MSEEKAILTKSEQKELDNLLALIAENLNAHVNNTLSEAHGVNASVGTYYDAGGDSAGDVIIRWMIGTPPNAFILYSPATTSILEGNTGTGLVRNAVNPDGTSNQPGVPHVDIPLITEFISTLARDADTGNSLLIEHSKAGHGDPLPLELAHGGIGQVQPAQADRIKDDLGHDWGRYKVQLNIGGKQYSIPADTEITGAPQPPRLDQASGPVASAHSSAPSGAPQSPITIDVTAYGTAPLTYQWQRATDATQTSWVDIGGPLSTVGQQETGNSWPRVGYSEQIVATTTKNTENTSTLNTTSITSPGDGSYSGIAYVRCLVYNDAGSVTSRVSIWSATDETSCCTVYSALLSRDMVEVDTLKDIVRYRLRFQSKQKTATQAWTGYMLLFSRMAKWIRDERHPRLVKLFVDHCAEPFHRFVQWKLGKGKVSRKDYWTSQVLYWMSVATYYVRRKEAEAKKDLFEGKSMISLYRDKLKSSQTRQR